MIAVSLAQDCLVAFPSHTRMQSSLAMQPHHAGAAQACVVAQVEKAPLESYADVGGLEQQIVEIKEAVELPLTHPELYEDIGIKPPKVKALLMSQGCKHPGLWETRGEDTSQGPHAVGKAPQDSLWQTENLGLPMPFRAWADCSAWGKSHVHSYRATVGARVLFLGTTLTGPMPGGAAASPDSLLPVLDL